MSPVITGSADASAVILNERGRVDLDHIAELPHLHVSTIIVDLGGEVFHDSIEGS
jgi:N12 class adenine-specific DNA methylase